jgi:hypothetical protein
MAVLIGGRVVGLGRAWGGVKERDRLSRKTNYVVSAIPTAAPEPEQPTSLSSPLVLPSLALPAPYPPARISDITNTNRL